MGGPGRARLTAALTMAAASAGMFAGFAGCQIFASLDPALDPTGMDASATDGEANPDVIGDGGPACSLCEAKICGPRCKTLSETKLVDWPCFVYCEDYEGDSTLGAGFTLGNKSPDITLGAGPDDGAGDAGRALVVDVVPSGDKVVGLASYTLQGVSPRGARIDFTFRFGTSGVDVIPADETFGVAAVGLYGTGQTLVFGLSNGILKLGFVASLANISISDIARRGLALGTLSAAGTAVQLSLAIDVGPPPCGSDATRYLGPSLRSNDQLFAPAGGGPETIYVAVYDSFSATRPVRCAVLPRGNFDQNLGLFFGGFVNTPVSRYQWRIDDLVVRHR